MRVKQTANGYIKLYSDGSSSSYGGSYLDDKEVTDWQALSPLNIIEPEFTDAELLQQIEDAKPKVVTMRQARLALLQNGLLTTITDAIANGTDEALKIEWEYATDVRREWTSLIALATSLGMTSIDLDNLFQLASTL